MVTLRLHLTFLLLAALGSAAADAATGALVRVPQDAPTLDAAISRVADGGAVELAAGTYASPPKGFRINNLRKGFTVRAAAGATVVIDGGGSRALLHYFNSDRARGKLVTFERLTFQNGFSITTNVSGGVTLEKSEALFRQCVFTGNQANGPTGGGAVKLLPGSAATFVDSVFHGNSARLRGGAIVVRGSVVTIQGGELVDNLTNAPGDDANSYGGAIMVLDGTLRVTGTRFEGNQASWVGGAIYAIGSWDQGSDVLVDRASFIGNQVGGSARELTGGALHAEDLTTLRVHQSLFVGNRADSGGAIDGYRSVVEVDGSVFQGNQMTAGHPDGAGGAISMFSSDFADASTNFGAINRRSGQLTVNQSLLQAGSGVTTAFRGGCILASGDGPRAFGNGDVPQAGSLDDNRARVVIRGTVFDDCDTGPGSSGGGGWGGALLGGLVDLTMEDSMVLDSDARGSAAVGGGIAVMDESIARFTRTTFAHDTSQTWGGALFLSGSAVAVTDCRFYGNDVVAGVDEPIDQSAGASIYSQPDFGPHALDLTGVVSGSTFADDLGLPLFESDSFGGPINALRYDGNRFAPNRFGDRVLANVLVAPGGINVGQLNTLTVNHGGLGTTVKSLVPDASFFGPHEGVVRAVPSARSVGAAAEAPTASTLFYAWSGGSAQLAGQQLPRRTGMLEAAPGDYTLFVDGTAAASAHVLGTCTAGSFLCLADSRFRVEASFEALGATGRGQAFSLTGDTGAFWFFDPSNVEVVVKVLDGRALNGHFWVFFGALSNLAYTVTVTDTTTGAVRTYVNPAGHFASVGDTLAFAAAASGATVDAAPTAGDGGEPLDGQAIDLLDGLDGATVTAAAACAPTATSLCLAGSRVRVELTWKDFSGHTGVGTAVPLSADTGYFWFTSPSNVEVIAKVLDATTVNGQLWFFYGALSNVQYTLTITDVTTGRQKSYTNPLNRFGSQGDTAALPAQ